METRVTKEAVFLRKLSGRIHEFLRERTHRILTYLLSRKYDTVKLVYYRHEYKGFISGQQWFGYISLVITDMEYKRQNRLVFERKGKLGAHVMKRVAAGAHLPTPWLFEP